MSTQSLFRDCQFVDCVGAFNNSDDIFNQSRCCLDILVNRVSILIQLRVNQIAWVTFEQFGTQHGVNHPSCMGRTDNLIFRIEDGDFFTKQDLKQILSSKLGALRDIEIFNGLNDLNRVDLSKVNVNSGQELSSKLIKDFSQEERVQISYNRPLRVCGLPQRRLTSIDFVVELIISNRTRYTTRNTQECRR